jgi:hypothetical protein
MQCIAVFMPVEAAMKTDDDLQRILEKQSGDAVKSSSCSNSAPDYKE